jgi:hypothetical protein
LTSAADGPSRWGTFAFAPGGQGGPVQAVLHRLLGNPDHRGRLSMRQPLDADQVEYVPLVFREALDRPQHASAVRAEAGGGADWRGRNPGFRQGRGGGLSI